VPLDIGSVVVQGRKVYTIKQLMSQGGFGKAFVAECVSPGAAPTNVVVKVPADHVLTDPVWGPKFAREARILANINHPNVVRIIAYWEDKDTGERALIQELVAGANDLRVYVKAQPNATASLLLQTLYALRAFHSSASPSAIHRDLSPSNILVAADGRVKVIDFGLAKEDPRATEALTQSGQWFGTAGCMSPEQLIDAAHVDHRTDLYAVGRSFTAALQDRPPQVARPDKLPEPWREICLKLTEDFRDDRPADADAALALAMSSFARFDVEIDSFGLHVDEMAFRGVANGWPSLVRAWVARRTDFSQSDVDVLRRVRADVYAAPFDTHALFDKLERSTGVSSLPSFEDTDAVGIVYARLYTTLDLPRKLACFRRICRVAVGHHRYAVMGDARDTFSSESDPNVRAQLLAVLDDEDPAKVIRGNDVIPGR
jgi:serine/threonine protein kinase